MTHFFAAEGGYQAFTLRGVDKFWLLFSGLTALAAIAVGFSLMKGVLAADEGTPKMKEIALAIQEGAWAYLKRQYKTIAVILIPLAIIVFVTSTKVAKPGGEIALGYFASGSYRTLAFLAGCMISGLPGYIGLSLSTRCNFRHDDAADYGQLSDARTGELRTVGIHYIIY